MWGCGQRASRGRRCGRRPPTDTPPRHAAAGQEVDSPPTRTVPLASRANALELPFAATTTALEGHARRRGWSTTSSCAGRHDAQVDEVGVVRIHGEDSELVGAERRLDVAVPQRLPAVGASARAGVAVGVAVYIAR